MLGYAFMGKAHSNALKKIAYMTVAAAVRSRGSSRSAGRNEEAVKEAARRYGYEKWSTDWRDVVGDPDVQVFDNGGPNDVHLEPTVAAATGREAHHLREAARPDGRRELRDLEGRRRCTA